MSVKRTVLESLARQRLVDLARSFEAEFSPSGMSKGDLIDGLARMKRTALEQLLPELSRDELKTACERLGLDTSGREKQVLIDRLKQDNQTWRQ